MGTPRAEDTSIDHALRPTSWKEYVGQEGVKRSLRVIIEAAQKRNEAMDHVLLCGQAGLGKTTLAHLITRETGGELRATSGPAIEKAGDLAALLSNLEAGQVLFIDEAHRLNRMIEEILYPAMESRKLHLMIGKGPSARSITLDLPPFTLIAATTRENLLSGPLRSRFGAVLRLEYYNESDIEVILKRSAKILVASVSGEAIRALARASRGTPRVANRLLKRARDFAEVEGERVIDEKVAKKTLAMLEVDPVGLEPQDRRLLSIIIEKFGGGPVGVGTLAAALGEEKGAIEDIYEPYLMKIGFLQRTSGGRVALPAAYAHMGFKRPGELL